MAFNSKNFDTIIQVYIKDSPLVLKPNKDERKIFANNETGSLEISCPQEFILLHELCHLVEVDESRLFKTDFGLTDVPNYQPKTCNASLRELRVFAFQINVAESLKVNESYPKTLKKILTEIVINLAGGRLAPGESYSEKLEYYAEKLAEYLEIYTVERFNQIWEKRMQILWAIKNEAELSMTQSHNFYSNSPFKEISI
jgi:hypothetical protein